MTAPSEMHPDRSGGSVAFPATLAAYQVSQGRLQALREYRAATASLPDMFRPQASSGATTLRTIRDERDARDRLRSALGDLIAASVRAGRTRSDLIERVIDDLRELVHAGILVADAVLTDQLIAWIVEDYPTPAVAPVRSRLPIRRGILSIESARSERAG